MYVLLAGLNHRTAPVTVREKFAICGTDLGKAYEYFIDTPVIEGAVILTTCNRTEIYATTRDMSAATVVINQFLTDYSGMEYEDIKDYLYQPNCYEAILHLFRVASGLDSMIVGEDQIIGQVKEAYQQAMEAGASNGILNSLFQHAIYVGKKVRTETTINSRPLSVSYAAVELARKTLGSLQGKSVLVVGAGEMSELTTRYLMMNGIQSVIVSNRSYDRAVAMAEKFGGRAIRFDCLAEELQKVDIVISCTAANHYVIREENCGKILELRNGKNIILIDIAVPRDIDPVLRDIKGVYIYDIDQLQDVVDSNSLEKQKAIKQADKIISEEMDKFNEWLASLYVVPVISALRTQADTIKETELTRALNRLGQVSDREKKIIGSLANSIVNQLLHQPVVRLKEMAVSTQGHLYAEVVKKLFDLSIENEEYQNEKVETRHKRQ